MDQNKEDSPLKISYRTTIDILDKETGREERKIFKDGKLVEHKVIKSGIEKET